MKLSDLELLHQLQEICYVRKEDEYGGFDLKLDKHRLNLIHIVAKKFDQAKIEHELLGKYRFLLENANEWDLDFETVNNLLNEIETLEKELEKKN